MRFLLSCFFIWMLFNCHCAVAQSPFRSVSPYERSIAWSKVAWDADKPYYQARKNIDAQIAAGASPETLAQKFERPMQLNNTLVQFKWAYAKYEAARKTKFQGHDLQTIKERLQFGSEQKAPHSAEFARLMFLTYSRFGTWENLADAGQRLVKKFPSDFEIKWFALKSLNPGRHPELLPVALSYARDLKKRQPNKRGINLLVPNIYMNIWYWNQTKKDGIRASNALKDFLLKAPKGDPGIIDAQAQIKTIRLLQPILDQKKKTKIRASSSE